jgi:predicted phosphodiesterase
VGETIPAMRVAVLADAHAHLDALEAVLAAAASAGVDELWSLGDMVGTGPDPTEVVARTRECCRIALLGNHDYLALGEAEANPSILHARASLDAGAVAWMRSRKPAARRGDAVQLWHGGPHNAVHEFVGPRNAPDCLARQRAPLGLVGHTHVPAAFGAGSPRVRVTPGVPLDISGGKWLLNPGAVFSRTGTASWMLVDLEARTATWLAAAFDPAPAAERARRLGFAL